MVNGLVKHFFSLPTTQRCFHTTWHHSSIHTLVGGAKVTNIHTSTGDILGLSVLPKDTSTWAQTPDPLIEGRPCSPEPIHLSSTQVSCMLQQTQRDESWAF